ncbi:MAG: glycosyltransferase family 39 protein [Ardenticatenaceae bacterium]|nr:glycosyltransferase family 39 protein [Ardenticatenaceae bacterium]MCB9003279.1 glycosyltransferase family 39 protein [Ardenticatenaceae bacterium]
MSNLYANRTIKWALIVLLLAGTLLRLTLLGSKSFWLDEANALRVSHLGQGVLWEGKGEGYHPPLFYMALEQWAELGEDEATLRLLAVIPSALSIPLLYLLGKKLLGKEAATTAVALMAFSPLLVWYAQEARPYALLGLLGLVAMLAAAYLRNQFHVFWWVALMISLTGGLYLHYFAVFIIPLVLLLLMASWAAKQASWAGTIAILTAVATSLTAYWPWLQSPAMQRFLDIARGDHNYVASLLTTRLNFLPDANQVYLLIVFGGLAAILISLLLTYYLTKAIRKSNTFQNLPAHRGVQILLVIGYAAMLVLMVWPRGYTLKRQLILFWPVVLLGFAWFWPWQPQSAKWLTPILALSLLASLVNVAFVPKPDWREMNTFITANQQSGDQVVLEPSYMRIPFNYYNQDALPQTGLAFGADEAVLQELVAGNGRIWLIIHEADTDSQQRNIAWFDRHARLVSVTEFYKLQVRLYE